MPKGVSRESPVAEGPTGRSFMRSRAVRRLAAVVSIVLAVVGVGVLARPLVTEVWADHKQRELRVAMDDPAFEEVYRSGDVGVGDGLTRLRIPRLNVDVVVAEGTSPEALRAGAGHYTGTPLPGQPGNVAIAGHRVTFGHPFQMMKRMRSGDTVTLETPIAVYTYTVVPPFGGHGNPWVVQPDDYWVVGRQPPGRWLTLTTCHPRGSARQRLVLRLELTDTRYLTLKGEA